MTDHIDAVVQDVLRRPRHRAARLAATKDHDAPVTRRNVEVAPDERGHIAGGEGGLPDRARVLARAHDLSLRRRSPVSRSTSTSRSECAGFVPDSFRLALQEFLITLGNRGTNLTLLRRAVSFSATGSCGQRLGHVGFSTPRRQL